jgi:hypothetical protein
MKFKVFCDILPCSQIEVDIDLTTRQYIPKDSERRLLHRNYMALYPRRLSSSHSLPENQKSHLHNSLLIDSFKGQGLNNALLLLLIRRCTRSCNIAISMFLVL